MACLALVTDLFCHWGCPGKSSSALKCMQITHVPGTIETCVTWPVDSSAWYLGSRRYARARRCFSHFLTSWCWTKADLKDAKYLSCCSFTESDISECKFCVLWRDCWLEKTSHFVCVETRSSKSHAKQGRQKNFQAVAKRRGTIFACL